MATLHPILFGSLTVALAVIPIFFQQLPRYARLRIRFFLPSFFDENARIASRILSRAHQIRNSPTFTRYNLDHADFRERWDNGRYIVFEEMGDDAAILYRCILLREVQTDDSDYWNAVAVDCALILETMANELPTRSPSGPTHRIDANVATPTPYVLTTDVQTLTHHPAPSATSLSHTSAISRRSDDTVTPETPPTSEAPKPALVITDIRAPDV
ncbi:hypothetical protein D9758_007052 [Tetrapyrgos nigripes]|uniref:Uncharacterized protein n=1 Tax=Tetrapyrgos nigripes TaxID=182062 RepID=A0A8H5GDW7_9AGAR|nr:hypothetical protein D9758_007052 [Tetrapyrgos nigripes]